MLYEELTLDIINDAKTDNKTLVISEQISRLQVRILPSGSKTYMVHFHITEPLTGRKLSCNETLGSVQDYHLEEARAWADDKEKSLNETAQTTKKFLQDPNLTVAEMCQFGFERELLVGFSKNDREKLNKDYQRTIARIALPVIGEWKVSETDERRCKYEWFTESNFPPRETNTCLSALQQIFDLAADWGIRDPDENPIRGLKRRDTNYRERLITRSELAELGERLVKVYKLCPQEVLIILLAFLTGYSHNLLRVASWDGYREGRLHIENPKTKEMVIIYLGKMAQDLINHIKSTRSRGNPWIFPGRFKNKHISRIDPVWSLINVDSHMEDVELHDSSYTFGVMALRSGESIINVAVLRDIRSVTTLERLQERAGTGVQEGVQRISDSTRQQSHKNKRS
jgi:integrase